MGKRAPKKGETNPSNPNGANQFFLDPRQKICWEYYVNPKSETFANATQSAIRAGYEEKYARQIMVSDWFVAKVRRLNLLGKSEKVLDEVLDMPIKVIKYDTVSGEDDDATDEPETYLETDPAIVRVKLDAAKFVASTQGKDEGYSTRSELSGPNGGAITIDDNTRDKSKSVIRQFLSRN